MDLILQVFLSVFSGILLSLAIPNEIYNLGQPIFTLKADLPKQVRFFVVIAIHFKERDGYYNKKGIARFAIPSSVLTAQP